jgi:hypothetical protein
MENASRRAAEFLGTGLRADAATGPGIMADWPKFTEKITTAYLVVRVFRIELVNAAFCGAARR